MTSACTNEIGVISSLRNIKRVKVTYLKTHVGQLSPNYENSRLVLNVHANRVQR